MRNIWESADTFEAAARVDVSIFMIEELYSKYRQIFSNRNGLDIMIDRSTGYEDKESIRLVEEILSLLPAMIADMKYLEYDHTWVDAMQSELTKWLDDAKSTTENQPSQPCNQTKCV